MKAAKMEVVPSRLPLLCLLTATCLLFFLFCFFYVHLRRLAWIASLFYNTPCFLQFELLPLLPLRHINYTRDSAPPRPLLPPMLQTTLTPTQRLR